MKNFLRPIWLLAVILAWGVVGCSNEKIDTAKLRGAFPEPRPEVQTNLDKGIAAIDAGNFAEALPALQRVAFAAKMNQGQRTILEDAIKKVKAKVK